MAVLRRFGVSMEADLLREFDALIGTKGYANRSDALRALVRSHLLETRIHERPAMQVVGTITLVYDHGNGDLPNRLTELQHRSHGSFVSTLHVHLDAHTCLEVLVVRGKLSSVRSISDSLCGTRGVRQGKLLIHAGADSRAPHRAPARGRHGRHPAP